MRSLIPVIALLISGNVLAAFAQETTTAQTGFAVVSPVSGNMAGVIATETLRIRSNSGVEQTIVAPSVLVTSASFLTPLGPVNENTTAIAIANPSESSGGVNLVLTDQAGQIAMNATVVLGPRGQLSKYLNDFLATQPAGFAAPFLLTVSSEIPIAILALNFRNGDFTSIPLTSLSTPTPVAVQFGVPPSNTTAGFGIGVATSPPTTFTEVPPGFGIGVSTQPPASTTAGVFINVPPTQTIGGSTALVFAQVVSGGGWSTDIAVGNTSSGSQIIRIDFFSSDGLNTGSLTDITIPPRGVFFFSSDSGRGALR